jgi:hypothetical protein
MSRPAALALALALLPPATALAAFDPPLHVDSTVDDCEVRFSPRLTQGAYRRFVREFGSVSAFKPGASPDPLGRWNVSLDVEAIFFSVEDHSAAWNDTFTHPDAEHELGSDKMFPKLRLRVGVTDRLDLGAFYTENWNANYGWVGLEAKYAVLDQRDGRPFSLAVRGAYTKTIRVADMDMHAVSADVSIGRTFWNVLTPYVGLGSDAVLARETSDAVALETESLVVPRLTTGFDVRWWRLAVGAEAHVSALTSYQAHVSAVF